MVMESSFPLVSIIIPVYNGSAFLAEAIDSALGQTYRNIEVIVVNDGSNDNGETERIALSYGDNIRYFAKDNQGVSSALNLGISHMKGDYFSWLSHDDKYEPEKIQSSISLLKNNNFDANLIAYTETKFINEHSQYLGQPRARYSEMRKYEPKENIKLMLKHGSLNGCALLIPRAAFAKAGMFDLQLRYCQDAIMWYRLFDCGFEVLSDLQHNVFSRKHSKQVTHTSHHLFESESLLISSELIDICVRHSSEKCNLLYEYAKRAARLNLRNVVFACKAKSDENGGFSFGDYRDKSFAATLRVP